MKYYTYLHTRNDTGKVFYIGKGIKKRMYSTKRNAYWRTVASKHGFTPEIIAYWETEEEALDHEVLLIAAFRDMGYKLANLTDGGEGNTGFIHGPVSRQRMSESAKKRRHSEETKKKMSEMRKGQIYTDAMRAKSRATKLGHSVSEEAREKIRQTLTGYKHSAETIAKRIAVRTGMSTAKKGQKAPTGQCKYCLRIMAKNTLALYHNEKCKLK